MTALDDACDELGRWLPYAAALITEPDIDGTAIHGTPGSRPPWNSASANAYFDAHAAIRETLFLFQLFVHGSTRPRSWTHASTIKALAVIRNLAHAMPSDRADATARELTHCTTAILQLPAIDETERPRKVDACCPYCGFAMMRLYARSGRVTCLRFGACFDSDGQHPVGMAENGVHGACIVWADGLVT